MPTRENIFHKAVNNLKSDVIIHIDLMGIITYVGDSIENIFGYKPDEIVGKDISILMDKKYAKRYEKYKNKLVESLDDESEDNQCVNYNLLGVNKEGNSFSIHLLIGKVKDDTSKLLGFAGLIYKASDYVYSDKYESLDYLLTQEQFEKGIEELFEVSPDRNINFIVLNLDNVVSFLNIQELREEIIKKIYGLILSNLRTHKNKNPDYNDRELDIVIGLFGYSFGVALFGTDTKQAQKIAERLRSCVEDTNFGTKDLPNHFTTSVGIIQNKGSDDMRGLLNKGFQASQIASDMGGNRIFAWNNVDISKIHWKEKLEIALEGKNGYNFELYCQYIKPLNTENKKLSYEILIRLFDNNGDIIDTGTFISIAEEIGIAVRIDKWVIENTFKWLSQNPEHMSSLNSCSINLSGPSLSNLDTYDFIVKKSDEYNIPPNKISFEITETGVVTDKEQADKLKEKLNKLGFKIVIDDFGVGNASFEKLLDKNIDKIKIDGKIINSLILKDLSSSKIDRLYHFSKILKKISWIPIQPVIKYLQDFIIYIVSKDESIDEVSCTIIDSICKVSNILGCETVAEFVNTNQQQKLLYILGIIFCQGYKSTGSPFPIKELEDKQNDS